MPAHLQVEIGSNGAATRLYDDLPDVTPGVDLRIPTADKDKGKIPFHSLSDAEDVLGTMVFNTLNGKKDIGALALPIAHIQDAKRSSVDSSKVLRESGQETKKEITAEAK